MFYLSPILPLMIKIINLHRGSVNSKKSKCKINGREFLKFLIVRT